MLDLSSGRAPEGERELAEIFGRFRSASWKRRGDLAAGVARLRRREFTQAEKTLREAESAGGPIAAFATLKRAEALVGLGRAPEAVATLGRSSPGRDDPVLADARVIGRARALVASGNRAEALRTLNAHLGSRACRDRARVMEAASDIAAAGGDAATALDNDRRIYLEEPRSPEAVRAAAHLAAASPASRRFRARDGEGVVSRARALIAAGDGKGALAGWTLFLTAVPESSLDTAQRLSLAESAIEARELTRALSLLGKSPVARGDARRGGLMARALMGLGRETQAVSVLRTVSEGAGADAANCRFLLATILDQTDHDRDALEQFLRYARDAHDGEHSAAALWRGGWLAYRFGRREDARRLFETLLDRPSAAAYHSAALYWLARTLESAGTRDRARDVFRRLEREHTRDYYGLLASARLRASAPGATTPPTGGHAPLALRTSAASTREEDAPQGLGRPSRAFCTAARAQSANAMVGAGCELETIGFYQDAEREYEAAAVIAPEKDLMLRLAELAVRRGDRASAMARFKTAVPSYLSVPIASIPMRYWEILYPVREGDAISDSALRRKLDPALVCGLILQESAFNPLAVSSAQAMGLMQILPGTGAEAARATGEAGFSQERLLEPGTNIRLGTWHFASLLERLNGKVELALAAYNAGETRAQRWAALFGTSDPTTFVEEIPYTETRLYVKRILSHAAMYRAIYGH